MEERQDLLEKHPTSPVESIAPTEILVVSSDSPSALCQDYDFLGELGRGGMGTVHKVRCRKTDELMALKLMKPELGSNPVQLKRFRQEAEMELHHCNIAKVYCQDVAANQAFIVMELVEGLSLSHQLAHKKMDEQSCIKIFLQICDALEYAHLKGVVHRDLKPSNVMIDNDDLVKITDFGTAKLIPTLEEDVTRLTRTGEIFGSPLYMSPEQCIGEAVDHRTDIYSMGCLMYEALSGGPAFPGANPIKVIFQQVNCDPEPLDSLGKGVSDGLSLVVGKCLQKDPALRYQSFASLRADLELVQKGKRPRCKIADQSLRILASANIAKRLAASVVDGAILTSLLVLLLVAVCHEMPPDLPLTSADLSFCFLSIDSIFKLVRDLWSQSPVLTTTSCLIWLFSGIINWLYRAGFESSPLKATPGKLILGLRLIDARGARVSFLRCSIRHFAKSLLLIAPIMVLMQAFGLMTIQDQTLRKALSNCCRRPWWDGLTGVRVIDVKSTAADSWRRQ